MPNMVLRHIHDLKRMKSFSRHSRGYAVPSYEGVRYLEMLVILMPPAFANKSKHFFKHFQPGRFQKKLLT